MSVALITHHLRVNRLIHHRTLRQAVAICAVHVHLEAASARFAHQRLQLHLGTLTQVDELVEVLRLLVQDVAVTLVDLHELLDEVVGETSGEDYCDGDYSDIDD